MKKLCFITTSRADFGTLDQLITKVANQKHFFVNIIVSGSHTSKIFGNTNSEIQNKKNCKIIRAKIKCTNNNAKNVTTSFADCVKKISNVLTTLKPNIFVVFGDRYEMLAATIAAYILRIPIAHIGGGEKTTGSIDDGFRHSISKLSNLHFPVADVYKKRLIQLGENPKTIFNYGSLNLTRIKKNNYLSKNELERKIKFKFYKKNLLITYHPETIHPKKSIKNLNILLNSIKNFNNTGMIITSPNADVQGVLMISIIKKFIKKNKLKNFLFVKSLGATNYLSLLKVVNGVIGNSSSGISEAPFFGIKTLNLGDRQNGRMMVSSIINCPMKKISIIKFINKILNGKFKNKGKNFKEFGDGKAVEKISKKLSFFDFNKYTKKNFYDL
jgi:GDP/UDP-N,N'-diacetylbacillosamine 2-epimerase (hydrolysing)